MSEKMFVITHVDFELAPQNPSPVFRQNGPPMVAMGTDEPAIPLQVYEEMVRGRRFVDRHGRSVCIGITGDAAKLLGLEYEAWETMARELDRLRDVLCTAERGRMTAANRLQAIACAGWWQRLVWLFTGVTVARPERS